MSNKGWHDELRIMKRIADRLEQGYEDYGPLVVGKYMRDPIEEAMEEVLDCMVYCAIKLELIQKLRGGQRDERKPQIDEPWMKVLPGRMRDGKVE